MVFGDIEVQECDEESEKPFEHHGESGF